jgi:hypothetical protein
MWTVGRRALIKNRATGIFRLEASKIVLILLALNQNFRKNNQSFAKNENSRQWQTKVHSWRGGCKAKTIYAGWC